MSLDLDYKVLTEVLREINDEQYSHYVHGKRGTYCMKNGCRGPLCKWAHRTYRREHDGHVQIGSKAQLDICLARYASQYHADLVKPESLAS